MFIFDAQIEIEKWDILENFKHYEATSAIISKVNA